MLLHGLAAQPVLSTVARLVQEGVVGGSYGIQGKTHEVVFDANSIVVSRLVAGTP